jgi:perosamine synthetase
MTTGDGGMISTDNEALVAPLKQMRWCGINKDTWQRLQVNRESAAANAYHWYYEVSLLGYKYNMNDLCASIGLVQLKKLDVMRRKREIILKRYLSGIEGFKHVKAGLPYDLNDSSYWMFMVRVKDRERFILHMLKKGVSTGVHYMPLTLHPLYEEYDSDLPVSKRIWKEFVTLPLFPDLTNEEVDYVIACIREFDREL